MAAPVRNELWLGHRRDRDAPVTLARAVLLRHVMALGSSGSGKTVFCKLVVEEAVRRGVPVICIDPQGDLCSLALRPRDPSELDKRGIGPDVVESFHQRADVRVFTPASDAGVALCADPVRAADDVASAAERVHAYTRIAGMVASLLGYDLDSDDGAGVCAVIDSALNHLADAGTPADSLETLSAYLVGLDDASMSPYERLWSRRKIATACQRLARLDVGARRLLFHQGTAIDVDTLLGRDGTCLPGRARVSVLYLNTLHSQEDKDFFVAAVVEALYNWMLRNPSDDLQALFYIDEVAPFIPPVRKPACKDGLRLLFKQARKYGLGCVMATQNPGDVDYKAMAQFGTWALGRLTTRQDLKKVEPTVKSLAPVQCDDVMAGLPALRPGEFTLLSPDAFDGVCQLSTRWLLSRHETLDEQAIRNLADARGWRETETETDVDAGVTAPSPREAGGGPGRGAPPKRQSNPAPADEDPTLHRHAKILARKKSMTTQEFVERAELSTGKARAALRALVAARLAGKYRDGRRIYYWAFSTGGRPDLGMPRTIAAIEPQITEERAVEIAWSKARSKFLGLVGKDEIFHRATLRHHLVYQLGFEERVRRSLLKRVFGRDYEVRLGNVYLHPRTLAVLVYGAADGIAFVAKPTEYASAVNDFDDVVRINEVAPASLVFDDAEWNQRRPPAEVRDHFKKQFNARPQQVLPVYVPLWRLELGPETGSERRVLTIDTVLGHEVDWPR